MYLSWILVVIGCGETEAEKIDEPVVEDTGCELLDWYLDSDGDGFGSPFETLV